jgi:hypothetical protein|tara:strand:- start:3041 stop:3274 length:234 start_codon:yes stop_codon:yes gene_type:complete
MQTENIKSRRKLSIKVTDLKEFSEIKEGLSYKKIIKSIQGSLPKGTTEISVEYTNRKGQKIARMQKVPLGRKKKLGR